MFDNLHLTNMLRSEVEHIPETGLPLDAFPDKIQEIILNLSRVRPARTYSNGCKSLNRPDSGKVTAKGKGVRRETESEGSRRQTSGLTDRNPI